VKRAGVYRLQLPEELGSLGLALPELLAWKSNWPSPIPILKMLTAVTWALRRICLVQHPRRGAMHGWNGAGMEKTVP